MSGLTFQSGENEKHVGNIKSGIWEGAVLKLCLCRGEGGSKIADYTYQKDNKERGGDQKLPILRLHSLWIAPNRKLGFVTNLFY